MYQLTCHPEIIRHSSLLMAYLIVPLAPVQCRCRVSPEAVICHIELKWHNGRHPKQSSLCLIFANSHPQFYQDSDSMCVGSLWSLMCDVTSCWCLCGSWYLCTLRHRPEQEQAPPCHQSRGRGFCHELRERGNKPIVNAVAECNDDMQWQCELKAIIYFLSRFIVLF